MHKAKRHSLTLSFVHICC